jgi:hypothetical protein
MTYNAPIRSSALGVIGEAWITCRSWNLRRACAIHAAYRKEQGRFAAMNKDAE